MSAAIEADRPRGRMDLDVWVRRGCTLIVAAVAAYSSYEHQRGFALRFGADSTNAALWPLSVDGLLLLATVGLLKPDHRTSRMRIAVWSAFLGCIAVSLAANIAAAPRLAWQPVLVAGWPPVALLLAVELLAHRSRFHQHTETEPTAPRTEPAAQVVQDETETARETGNESGRVIALAEAPSTTQPAGEPTAQEVMWAHYQKEQQHGRTPTGAELDRVAGTNNYGRTVLRSGASKAASPRRMASGPRQGVRHDQRPARPPARPGRHHPPRRALARLALSAAYREAADFAAGGVPTVSDEYGDAWDYVDHAARLVAMAQDVLARAVVYARERGGT